MKRDDLSSVSGYGNDTANHLWAAFNAFGVRNNSAKLYCYLMSHTKRASAFCGLEAKWIEDWTAESETDASAAFFVQIANAAVAAELFGGEGNENATRTAIGKLVSLGLLQLVKRGCPGHGSLYLWCEADFANRNEKQGKDAVYEKPKLQGNRKKPQESLAKPQQTDDKPQRLESVTCGNDAVSNYPSSIQHYPKAETSETRGGESRGVRCPACGSENTAELMMHSECDDCGAKWGEGFWSRIIPESKWRCA